MSTLWDQYIRTQGLTIPDPLYKSPGAWLSQEAQVLRSNTGGTPPPGADGTAGSANRWAEINPGTTWEDYGPRLQVPKGYTLNEGPNYTPFDIHLPSGELQPAKYIKLEYREDPLIYGMIDGDPH